VRWHRPTHYGQVDDTRRGARASCSCLWTEHHDSRHYREAFRWRLAAEVERAAAILTDESPGLPPGTYVVFDERDERSAAVEAVVPTLLTSPVLESIVQALAVERGLDGVVTRRRQTQRGLEQRHVRRAAGW
jgi:hypothetical protein